MDSVRMVEEESGWGICSICKNRVIRQARRETALSRIEWLL